MQLQNILLLTLIALLGFNCAIPKLSYQLKDGKILLLKTNGDGKVLNDTTFVILNETLAENDKTRVRNDTFHFRRFSPKPDSTTQFIK